MLILLVAFQAVMIYRAQGNGNNTFFFGDAGETQIISQYKEDPLRKLYTINREDGSKTLESLIGSISAFTRRSDAATDTEEVVFIDYIVPLGNTVNEKGGNAAIDSGETVFIDYIVPKITFSDSLLSQIAGNFYSISASYLNGSGMLIGDVYGINKECFE